MISWEWMTLYREGIRICRYWARLSLPIRGHPKTWAYCTVLYLACSSRALINPNAPPKLLPVTMIGRWPNCWFNDSMAEKVGPLTD